MRYKRWVIAILFGVTLLAVGCGPVHPFPLPTLGAAVTVAVTPPPTSPVIPTEDVNENDGSAPPTSLPPTMAPAGARYTLSAEPGVPEELTSVAADLALARPDLFRWQPAGPADIMLVVGRGAPLAAWTYALAAPFITVADEVDAAELNAAWDAGRLQMTGADAAAWAAIWAAPASPTPPVDSVAAALWTVAEPGSPATLGVVPFHALTPDLKVMIIAGQSPLDPDLKDLSRYPLQLTIGLDGDQAGVAALQSLWPGPTSNREPARMTTVAMSGVTALTRATAYFMELNGVLYPGQEVRSVLRAADIAHVSNEVSFAPDCPYPNPAGDTTFCSRDAYFELLTDIGVDVVELTGNHVNDWGAENLAHSLDLYDAAGMTYFGGGANLADASAPLLLDHNGNRIAFVGCNPVGPAFAWATVDRPGSRPCDFAAFYAEINQLRAEGYLVIATLQYWESYHYAATAGQRADFRAVADAGAAVVSGSQGHHAQGFDLYHGSVIHYGLSNLFFDQMEMAGTRQTFVDTYTIYDGRLLSVTLWTGLIENWSRPRLATLAERAGALNAVFAVTDWEP